MINTISKVRYLPREQTKKKTKRQIVHYSDFSLLINAHDKIHTHIHTHLLAFKRKKK